MNKEPFEIDFRRKIFNEFSSVEIEPNTQFDENLIQIILGKINIPLTSEE